MLLSKTQLFVEYDVFKQQIIRVKSLFTQANGHSIAKCVSIKKGKTTEICSISGTLLIHDIKIDVFRFRDSFFQYLV